MTLLKQCKFDMHKNFYITNIKKNVSLTIETTKIYTNHNKTFVI